MQSDLRNHAVDETNPAQTQLSARDQVLGQIRTLIPHLQNRDGLELDSLVQHPPRSFKLADLDSYARVLGHRSENLCLFLAALPPPIVREQLGFSTLVWLYSHSEVARRERNHEFTAELQKSGFQIDLLVKARHLEWYYNAKAKDPEVSTESVLRWHDIFTKHDSAEINIKLPEILAQSARKGVSLTATRLADYALVPIATTNFQEHGSDNRFSVKHYQLPSATGRFELFMDAPLGLCLTYKDLPQALVSFYPSSATALKVVQLQGKKLVFRDDAGVLLKELKPRGLMPFHGLELMLRAAVEYAKIHGFDQIQVRPAKENPHSIHLGRDDGHHLPAHRAEAAYDQPAKALSFSINSLGNWCLDL